MRNPREGRRGSRKAIVALRQGAAEVDGYGCFRNAQNLPRTPAPQAKRFLGCHGLADRPRQTLDAARANKQQIDVGSRANSLGFNILILGYQGEGQIGTIKPVHEHFHSERTITVQGHTANGRAFIFNLGYGVPMLGT
jgi:hypothetical protein